MRDTIDNLAKQVHTHVGVVGGQGSSAVLWSTMAASSEWREDPMPRVRRVNWTHQTPRDGLTVETRNTLGAIASFFRPSEDASEALWKKALPLGSQATDAAPPMAPRIAEDSFVEVKQRNGSMGADELRKFLGGRRAGDRCLYVSTGGFTKEARYEAERANVPLTVISLPKLREFLLRHYESLDPSTRALAPLQRLY